MNKYKIIQASDQWEELKPEACLGRAAACLTCENNKTIRGGTP